MAKGVSYDIRPQFEILPSGTLLKSKNTMIGNLAAGINEGDEDLEFGGEEEIEIPRGSTLMYMENVQFMSSGKGKPMSAWIRCHLIYDQKVTWITLVCEPKRIWDFETFRGKKRTIQDRVEEYFEVLQLGNAD